jgi:UDP-2,3-diacylglucosamine hydrolase
MTSDKAVFFASDFHLGSDGKYPSVQREKFVVQWLDSIKHRCHTLYLVGDIFDYWFEYKEVIPKGYTRLFGKLAELTDSGIEVHMFTGNHDMWIKDYFLQEFNIKIYYEPIVVEHFNKKLYIAHGDGLGPGDYAYKFIKKIFSNPICKWLFQRIHPNLGMWIMRTFSATSRHYDTTPSTIEDMEKEWLVMHSREVLERDKAINFFIYGHRHFPTTHSLSNDCEVIYLGDWITNFTYAELNSKELKLLKHSISQV